MLNSFIFYKEIQHYILPSVLRNVLCYRLCAVNLFRVLCREENVEHTLLIYTMI